MPYAVIMAGGAGTRLWPMSRAGKPKQLLHLFPPETSGQPPRSLLQLAAARLRGLLEPAHIYICTGAAYEQQILDELPLLAPAQLLGEPVGRDTANAVGFSAAILHKRDPDAAFAVLTADHVISPIDIFQSALRTAFNAVEKHPELLITFGITPTFPASGYGYLHRGPELPDLAGVHRVIAFKEKPKEDLAREYLASGQYAWNSGMFVWKAKTILNQLQQHLPAAHATIMKIADAWDTPREQEVLNTLYPTLPKISIDFAIMEKAPHVATVAMPIQWLDVGSWPSFAETLPADGAHNRTGANTKTLHLDSTNLLTVSEDPAHLLATINCQDLVIIHAARATLVCPAKDAEKIKQLVAQVEKHIGADYV